MTVQYRALDYAAPLRRSAARGRIELPSVLVTIGLVAADALALGAAFGLAYLVRFKATVPLLEELPPRDDFYLWVVLWALPIWLGLFVIQGLYQRRILFAGFREYTRVVNACTTGVVAVILVSFLDVNLVISRGWLLLVWALTVLLVGSSRFAVRRAVWRLRSDGLLLAPTVIVGANEEGRALAEHLLADPRSGLRILGFVDPAAQPGTPVVDGLAVLGGLQELKAAAHRWGVREIVVASTAVSRDDLIDLYGTFGLDEGVELRLSSGLFEILTTGVVVHEASCVPLMTPQRVRITGIDALLKTLLDYAGAFFGLLALSPFLLLVALLIKLDSGGPVLYRRRVLGRSGKPFDAFKFCTMIPDRRQRREPIDFPDRRRTDKTPHDPRVTRVGAFLRRTSLDELPQLINVLRGEMSLIGPRMIIPEETALYGKWRLNLLTVKPGITGPWQVNGRGEIPYDERVRLSMHYIRSYSIWMDLEILLRTIPVVLQGKGAY